MQTWKVFEYNSQKTKRKRMNLYSRAQPRPLRHRGRSRATKKWFVQKNQTNKKINTYTVIQAK